LKNKETEREKFVELKTTTKTIYLI